MDRDAVTGIVADAIAQERLCLADMLDVCVADMRARRLSDRLPAGVHSIDFAPPLEALAATIRRSAARRSPIRDATDAIEETVAKMCAAAGIDVPDVEAMGSSVTIIPVTTASPAPEPPPDQTPQD